MVDAPRPAAFHHLSDRAIKSVIIGLMLAILLGALDQTIVSVSLPRMAEQLHGFDLLAWVVSGYLVASTIATPIYGKLGDLFGRRVLLSVAIGIFLVASVACGASQTMPELVASRVLLGLGGGGLISIAQAIIADIVPLRERGRYQGYISGVYAVASVAGPIVGGLLTHYLSWRWIFWINLPLGTAAFLVSRRALKDLPVPGVRKSIDYAGAVLLSAGLGALLIGITRVGQGVAWGATENLQLFTVAFVLLGCFVYWETRAAEPIVPLKLFRIRAAALCFGILFLGFFQLISLSVLIPLRFQIVVGLTADHAAWRLVPLSLLIPIGAFVAGRLMTKTGRYRPIQLVGASIVPIMILAIALFDPHRVVLTGVAMALTGFGIGLQFPTSLVAVQNSVPAENIGIATAATAFFRSMGGAIGVAVLSSILLAALRDGGAALGPGFTGGEMMREMLGGILAQGDETSRAALRMVAENAFERIFTLDAVIAMIPFLLTLYVPEKPLRDRSK